jgi:hypothetical protein
MDGLLQLGDEGVFVNAMFDTGICNRVKYCKWTAKAQDFAAKEDTDRCRPLTQDVIHRKIWIKQTSWSAAGHRRIVRNERVALFAPGQPLAFFAFA